MRTANLQVLQTSLSVYASWNTSGAVHRKRGTSSTGSVRYATQLQMEPQQDHSGNQARLHAASAMRFVKVCVLSLLLQALGLAKSASRTQSINVPRKLILLPCKLTCATLKMQPC
jgi:hypothetical protein